MTNAQTPTKFTCRRLLAAGLLFALVTGCATSPETEEGAGTGPGGIKSMGFGTGLHGNVDFGERRGKQPGAQVPPLPTAEWYEFSVRGGAGTPPLTQESRTSTHLQTAPPQSHSHTSDSGFPPPPSSPSPDPDGRNVNIRR